MKELPYFKFNVTEYIMGDIAITSDIAQGLFTKVMCWYWHKDCQLDMATINTRILMKDPERIKAFQELIDLGVIKPSDGDEITIDFLDEQFQELLKQHENRSKAGKKGGRVTKEQRKRGPKKPIEEAKPEATPESSIKPGPSIKSDEDKDEDENEDTDNKESLKQDSQKGKPEKGTKKIPYKEVLKLYNEICTDLPKAEKLNDSRRSQIRARLKDYDLDIIKNVFELCQASDFICARSEESKWKGGFDWIMGPKYFQKIKEGYYENKGRTAIDIISADENFKLNG